jgi:cob(I)alamin adenosyltransferase
MSEAEMEDKPRRGMLLCFTGQGKGKTTAAFGIAFRALGWNMKVAIIQFIKGKWKTGERVFAESLPQLTCLVMGRGFTWESDDISRDKRAAVEAWEKSRELIASGAHDIVILDELTYVINYGFVPLDEILTSFKTRPAHVHVVVTGRKAPELLLAQCDLVTVMDATKHPYASGVPAQKGIDF